MKILFLATNPLDVITQLRIDEEFREITQSIRLSSHSDQLEVASELAVRARDLQMALLRHKPDIVHFSGHGSPTSEIVLEDETGNRKVVNQKALSDLFGIMRHKIQMVVLSACYSKEQSQALTETVDFTIGTSAAIEDGAARTFAARFYQLLAFGCSLKEAFDLAINQLAIEGINVTQVPELLEREGANASEFRIVEPSRHLVDHESKPAASMGGVVGKRAGHTLIPEDNPDSEEYLFEIDSSTIMAFSLIPPSLIAFYTIGFLLSLTGLIWCIFEARNGFIGQGSILGLKGALIGIIGMGGISFELVLGFLADGRHIRKNERKI